MAGASDRAGQGSWIKRRRRAKEKEKGKEKKEEKI